MGNIPAVEGRDEQPEAQPGLGAGLAVPSPMGCVVLGSCAAFVAITAQKGSETANLRGVTRGKALIPFILAHFSCLSGYICYQIL